jgi:hypothetical protein
LTLVEVGVACGSSLKMWAKYFTNAHIVGIDIRPECAQLCEGYENITIVIADARLEQVAHDADIFIDDGSHISADIVDTITRNWKRVKPGGFYVIEDLNCTHDANYKNCFNGEHSESRFDRKHFAGLIDGILRVMDAEQSDVEYIHFYSKLAVIKKKGGVSPNRDSATT